MAQKKGRRTTTQSGPGVSRGAIIVGIIAVLAIGTVVAVSVYSNKTRPCTPTGNHEHASFAVYANDRQYVWTGQAFDYPTGGSLAGHIHQPSSQTIHMESGTTCITLSTFFTETLRGSLTKDTLQLDTIEHGGATFHDGQNGTLRFFLGVPASNWTLASTQGHYPPASNATWREEPNLPAHQPHDGEYLLVVFGNDTDAQIRQMELAMPSQNQSEGGGH